MNARFYLPNTGRFLTADTIVPDPTNPQSANRYSYVYGNPINLVDPSGHFTQDEIIASLTEQYGLEEAERIWNLWMLDPTWMWVLSIAQDGWTIWASDKGYGVFDVDDRRIRILWQDIGNGNPDSLVELFEFQGQGGYLLRGLKNESPSVGPCGQSRVHCYQPIFDYDSEGRIIGETPTSAKWIWWEYGLLGTTVSYFDEGRSIYEAPWFPSTRCNGSVPCRFGERGLFKTPIIGKIASGLKFGAQLAKDFAVDLMVVHEVVEWSPTGPGGMNFFRPPDEFSRVRSQRIGGH